MAVFIYEATNKEGFLVTGEYDASDKESVIEYLHRKEFTPVAVREKGMLLDAAGLRAHVFEHITILDRILLVRNLSAAIRAGLSLHEALDILIPDASNNSMKKILAQAKANLENGQPLSATFQYFPHLFPPVFIGLIKAGEASGQFDKALDELTTYLVREYELNKKIRSALAYPALLLVASTGIILLLLVFVLPRLQRTFMQSGVELPAITKMLVVVSSFLTRSVWVDAALLGLLVAAAIYIRRTRIGQKIFTSLLLRLPLVKDLMRKIYLVRFTKTLGSMIASGISIIEGLRLAADSIGNAHYKEVVQDISDQVMNGVALSRAMEKYPELFPRFLSGLVVVGERTGTLENILKTFADFYTEEVDHSLKTLTTFLEPLLLLIMGLVVGMIALSILLPIYQLVGAFT